jgi:hypothetical protein
MKDPTGGKGTILALLERLNTFRMPRALALKDRVDRGEKLDNRDRMFLKEVAEDMSQARRMLSKHPEFEPLVQKMADLYAHISQKAVENEQKP